MPFVIDTVSNPTDDYIVAAYPANARAHRTTMKSIVTSEDAIDEATGYLKGKSVADDTARDALTPVPTTGTLVHRQDLFAVERVTGAGPTWGLHSGYGYGTIVARDALASVPVGYAWIEAATGRQTVWSGTAWLDVFSFGESSALQGAHTHAIAANDTIEVVQDASGDLAVSITSVPAGVVALRVEGFIRGFAASGQVNRLIPGVRLTYDPDASDGGSPGPTDLTAQWAHTVYCGNSDGAEIDAHVHARFTGLTAAEDYDVKLVYIINDKTGVTIGSADTIGAVTGQGCQIYAQFEWA